MLPRPQIEELLVSPDRSAGLPPGAVLPDYGRYAIDGVPGLLEHILGRPGDAPVLAEALDPNAGAFDHVVFLLLDGLGYDKLLRSLASDPRLVFGDLAERGDFLPITSVFPSTTVTALSTYSTGRPPCEHGMVGYRLYLREASSITNMIRFSTVGNTRGDSVLDAGLDLDRLLTTLTLYERLAERGVATHVLLPQYITSSGLSRLLYRGADAIQPCATLADMFASARQILLRADRKTLLTLYYPGLDTIGHARGPETESYVAELGAISEAIRREWLGRVGRTLLVLSSDHGFMPIRTADYRKLPKDGGFLDLLALPPTGEPRATYLHARSGASAHLHRAVDEFADERLWISSSDDALDLGLLGDGSIHRELESRIGDLIVASIGDICLYHEYPDAALLPGMHGGLTRDEMLVPLIVSPL